MNGIHRRYISFLLRLWRDESSPSAWRASLEDAATGERKGFATLEMLTEFLVKSTNENQHPEESHENNLRLPPDL